MKPWTVQKAWVLTFVLGAGVGCGDDQTGTTPAETTSTTAAGTTTTSTTSSTGPDASTGTSGTGTTGIVDALAPWYGAWYTLYPDIVINEPEWWGSGGDSLGFTLFELHADTATIQVESCLWGPSKFEYTTAVDEDGVVVLEPVGGEHEFLPHGEIERLYVEPGADCSALVVREVRKGGEVVELFSSSGGPLTRGELCLEKCAPTQGMQGVISDCGRPVPWQCSG